MLQRTVQVGIVPGINFELWVFLLPFEIVSKEMESLRVFSADELVGAAVLNSLENLLDLTGGQLLFRIFLGSCCLLQSL